MKKIFALFVMVVLVSVSGFSADISASNIVVDASGSADMVVSATHVVSSATSGPNIWLFLDTNEVSGKVEKSFLMYAPLLSLKWNSSGYIVFGNFTNFVKFAPGVNPYPDQYTAWIGPNRVYSKVGDTIVTAWDAATQTELKEWTGGGDIALLNQEQVNFLIKEGIEVSIDGLKLERGKIPLTSYRNTPTPTLTPVATHTPTPPSATEVATPTPTVTPTPVPGWTGIATTVAWVNVNAAEASKTTAVTFTSVGVTSWTNAIYIQLPAGTTLAAGNKIRATVPFSAATAGTQLSARVFAYRNGNTATRDDSVSALVAVATTGTAGTVELVITMSGSVAATDSVQVEIMPSGGSVTINPTLVTVSRQ